MATATLPPDIEVFRPGRHIDDQGGIHDFSPADVADIAASYNPALHEAPLTVGHPEHDRPAYGWVEGAHVNDEGRLAIASRDVEPQFAEMVAQRRFAKRSAAFYPPSHPKNPTPGKWYLRHVAFLGAQPPAIAGLKEIQFADDAAGLVCFSEASSEGQPTQEHRTMSDQEKAAIARAEKAEADALAAQAAAKAAQDQLAQFAEQQRTARHAGFVAFAESQVQAGKLAPKDRDMCVATLEAVADAAPVQFAEGGTTRSVSPATWLQGLIANAAPVVQFGEFAPGAAAGQRHAPPKDDAELDARAQAYARDNKVSYAEAVAAVVSITA